MVGGSRVGTGVGKQEGYPGNGVARNVGYGVGKTLGKGVGFADGLVGVEDGRGVGDGVGARF